MNRPDDLPPQMTIGATLSGNEYGWRIDSFQDALSHAKAFGFACLGGQFQFRLDTGTREMYWLDADSRERELNETWSDFCHRSCSEVSNSFNKRLTETDFAKKAAEWLEVRREIAQGADLNQLLVFVAYFVNETEYVKLNQKHKEPA